MKIEHLFGIMFDTKNKEMEENSGMNDVMMKIVDECVEMIKECVSLQKELGVAVLDEKGQDYIRAAFIPEYVNYRDGKLTVEGSSLNAFAIPINEILDIEYDDFEDSYILIRAGKTYDLMRLE